MKGRQIHYSEDELKFINRHLSIPRRELTRLFNLEYDRDVSHDNIKALCVRKGFLTGRTGCFEKGIAAWNKGRKGYMGANRTSFKKGHIPPNRKPLWTERISKDGYIEIKVPEKNPHTGHSTRYRLKHCWIWEQVNGKIPDSSCVSFIDGDKLNCKIVNLELISRQELLQMNKLRYSKYPEELKPVVKTLGKLIAKTYDSVGEVPVAETREVV